MGRRQRRTKAEIERAQESARKYLKAQPNATNSMVGRAVDVDPGTVSIWRGRGILPERQDRCLAQARAYRTEHPAASNAAVDRAIGVTEGTVGQWVHQGKILPSTRQERAREMIADDPAKTLDEVRRHIELLGGPFPVSRRLGLAASTVYRWMNTARYPVWLRYALLPLVAEQETEDEHGALLLRIEVRQGPNDAAPHVEVSERAPYQLRDADAVTKATVLWSIAQTLLEGGGE